MEKSPGKGAILRQALPWVLYIVLSMLMTWPLVTSLSTRLAGRDTDIFNVYWGNWWVRAALLNGQNPYFTTHLIYPIGFDLTTFAFSPFLALLWTPLDWLFGATVAYNLVVLVTTVMSCVSTYHLIRYLTDSPWAALVGGVVVGFAPCLAGERTARLNLSVILWLPLASLFLTRLLREAKWRDVALLALTVALAFLTRLHVGVLTCMFVGVYFVGLWLVERRRWQKLAAQSLLLACALSLLLLSPLLLHIAQLLSSPTGEDLLRTGAESRQTDLLAYVVPHADHPFFGRWTKPVYQQRLTRQIAFPAYVGIVPLLLCFHAVISRPKQALPWLLAAGVFFVLALGPYLRFNGQVFPGIRLPYSLGSDLFAAIGFDVPTRFNLAMMPAVGVLIGLAVERLVARASRPWPAVVLTGMILFEYLIRQPLMRLPPYSAFYDQLASDQDQYAIVDLPLARAEGEFHRYYQTFHHKPIVGGWDHRVPSTAFEFIESNALLQTWRTDDVRVDALPSALAHLSSENVRYFVLHKDQLRAFPEGMRALFSTVKPVYEDKAVYVLPTAPEPAGGYYLAHRFEGGLILVEPYFGVLSDHALPALTLTTCWLQEQETQSADNCSVEVVEPGGDIIAEREFTLPTLGQAPACQNWTFDLGAGAKSGPYQLALTPFVSGHPLETYTMTQSIQVFQDLGGVRATLGQALPVSFDAPIEMLGYNIQPGQDILWLDTYWRGLADHYGSYVLFVQLIDPVTRAVVVRSSDDVIRRLEWQEGDIAHERRLLMVNDMPLGQYALSLGLYRRGALSGRIAAFNVQTGDKWPGAQVILDLPILVQPYDTRARPAVGQNRVVVYSKKQAWTAPTDEIDMRFGNIGRLVGYRLEPERVSAGQPTELTLYWKVIQAESQVQDYHVFVHVVGRSGQIIAQHDGQPAKGRQPTYTWRGGDRIVDVHELTWLESDYVGTATLMVGLYDLQTLERLPAYREDGDRWTDDRAALGEIEVHEAKE